MWVPLLLVVFVSIVFCFADTHLSTIQKTMGVLKITTNKFAGRIVDENYNG